MSVLVNRGRVNGQILSVGFGGHFRWFVNIDDLLHPFTDKDIPIYGQSSSMAGVRFPITGVRAGTKLKLGLRVSCLLVGDGIGDRTFADDVMELMHRELHFSEDNWWEEIGRVDGLPEELKGLLRDLLSTTSKNLIKPHADARLIRLAQEHLSDTVIVLGENKCYSIMVFVPDDSHCRHHIFLLVPCYLNGELRRLSEF